MRIPPVNTVAPSLGHDDAVQATGPLLHRSDASGHTSLTLGAA